MKRVIKLITVFAVWLTACSEISTQQYPTSTPNVSTSVTEEPISDNECSQELALKNANSFFDGFPEYSIKYSVINDLKILSAWVMLSELNPTASTSAEIDQNTQMAMGMSLTFQATLASEGSCIRENFTHIEIILVDTHYHGWVSQIVNVNDIPDNFNFNFEELQPLFKKAKISYWRNQPTENLLPINEEPTWKNIRKTIEEILPNKIANTSFTLIVDASGVDVLAQWQEPNDGSQEYKEADMQLTVEKILAVLKTMQTQPDMLEFTVVDMDGNILKMGRVPKLDVTQVQVLSAPFNFDFNAP